MQAARRSRRETHFFFLGFSAASLLASPPSIPLLRSPVQTVHNFADIANPARSLRLRQRLRAKKQGKNGGEQGPAAPSSFREGLINQLRQHPNLHIISRTLALQSVHYYSTSCRGKLFTRRKKQPFLKGSLAASSLASGVCFSLLF